MAIYSGLKGVKLCEFYVIEEANRDCQWKMPIVTLMYQQGAEDGSTPVNNLEIMGIDEFE